MTKETEKQIWETFLAKPTYPDLNRTYSIRSNTKPIEDTDQKNRYLVDAVDVDRKAAVRLIMWEATLRELAVIMASSEADNTLVVFHRDTESNRTHVKRCTEAL